MRSIIHPLKGAFPSVARDRSRGSVSVGGPDETLECEVGPLLDSYRQDGSFLERPAFEVAARDLAVLSRPGDQNYGRTDYLPDDPDVPILMHAQADYDMPL